MLILLAAAAFGLLATYHALVTVYQFSAVEAPGIIAAGLALLGLLVLASVPLLGAKARRTPPTVLDAAGGHMGRLDQGVGKAMRQVGPVTLLVIAFLAGVLASRR